MAENVITAGAFTRPFVKAAVCAEDRFALAQLAGELDLTEHDMVRLALVQALEAHNWPQDRCVRAYAEHRALCLQRGTTNAYGKE